MAKILQKSGDYLMIFDEFNAKMQSISYDDMVCYTEIRSPDDVRRLTKKGYLVELTASEFSSRFPSLPLSSLWFLPAISVISLYYNPETMATCPIQISFMIHADKFGEEYSEKSALQAIHAAESEVSKGNYQKSVYCFPESLRIEYFNRLVEKITPENLYSLFISVYKHTDFCFSSLSSETLNKILNSKTEEDISAAKERISSLPETVEIYRGGNTLSTPWQSSLSWTTDINVASFFAVRSGMGPGYIVRAEVKKCDIVDFLSRDSEQEVLVNPDASSFRSKEEIELPGIDYLKEIFPKIVDDYHMYRDKLYKLKFKRNSEQHGKLHCARVMLLCLILASELKLSKNDKDILCTAAIFHDSQRDNDWDDSGHGEGGRKYYCQTVQNPNSMVEFLCTYHCRPDTVGYKKIQEDRLKSYGQAKLLFDVFKDADALDRIRFGIRDLDLNQLRLKESKSLVLVAKLNYKGVQI